MIQKYKSTSPSAIQVKIGERQSVLKGADLKRANKLLTCAVMLDSPILAYIQFVIMLIELKKVLNQELKFTLKHLKTLQHVSIIVQIIFRELICSLLKLLILGFVKNVKVSVVMWQHNIWCVYVRSV